MTHAVSSWVGGLLAGGLSCTINSAPMAFATDFAAEEPVRHHPVADGGVKSGAIEEPKPNESIPAGIDKDLATYERGVGAVENAEVAKGNLLAVGFEPLANLPPLPP